MRLWGPWRNDPDKHASFVVATAVVALVVAYIVLRLMMKG